MRDGGTGPYGCAMPGAYANINMNLGSSNILQVRWYCGVVRQVLWCIHKEFSYESIGERIFKNWSTFTKVIIEHQCSCVSWALFTPAWLRCHMQVSAVRSHEACNS